MPRPRREDLDEKESVEDGLAYVNRIDNNQRRIAERSRDPHILYEVEDTRAAVSGLRGVLKKLYPGKEKRDD